MTKRYRLEKLSMDEVSLVESGDDPHALQVLAKAAPVSKMCGAKHDKLMKGEKCPDCGEVMKMSPQGSEMKVDAPLDVMDFRHAKAMKRKKRKWKMKRPY